MSTQTSLRTGLALICKLTAMAEAASSSGSYLSGRAVEEDIACEAWRAISAQPKDKKANSGESAADGRRASGEQWAKWK